MTEYNVQNGKTGNTTTVPAEDGNLGDSGVADTPVQPAGPVEAPVAPGVEDAPTSDQFVGTVDEDTRKAADEEVVEVQRQNAEDSAEAAAQQRAEDVQFVAEHPYEPLIRAANPDVGGERFYF